MKEFANNRKAFHEYEILDTYTAGICLNGWEVKSILNSSCSIGEGFVSLKGNETTLKQVHISLYNKKDPFSDSNETRDRKLLLNKSEIKKITKKVVEKGLTVIPLSIFYSETCKIKVKIAVVKGKKNYDKREDLKKKQHIRETIRETMRELKNHSL